MKKYELINYLLDEMPDDVEFELKPIFHDEGSGVFTEFGITASFSRGDYGFENCDSDLDSSLSVGTVTTSAYTVPTEEPTYQDWRINPQSLAQVRRVGVVLPKLKVLLK